MYSPKWENKSLNRYFQEYNHRWGVGETSQAPISEKINKQQMQE